MSVQTYRERIAKAARLYRLQITLIDICAVIGCAIAGGIIGQIIKAAMPGKIP
jgi:hypothetical protein